MNPCAINSFILTPGTIGGMCRNIISGSKRRKSGFTVLPCSLNDLAWASKDLKSHEAYKKVDLLLPDGMPLVWYMRSKGVSTERIYGPALMMHILEKTSLEGSSHVFYGSSLLTLQLLQKKLSNLYPTLKHIHMISPPYRELTAKEESHYIHEIIYHKPNYLWIGLSSPKQVLVAARWKTKFPHTTILCVGAAFDLIAGTKPQAPKWMQRMGLEWLFRLASEPRRLGRRYCVDIPSYVLGRIVHAIMNPSVGAS